MELILKGTIHTPQPDAVLGQLFPGEPVNPEHAAFVGRFGMVNIEELLAKNERLRIVDEVARRVRASAHFEQVWQALTLAPSVVCLYTFLGRLHRSRRLAGQPCRASSGAV
jgi:hypothetical protein